RPCLWRPSCLCPWSGPCRYSSWRAGLARGRRSVGHPGGLHRRAAPRRATYPLRVARRGIDLARPAVPAARGLRSKARLGGCRRRALVAALGLRRAVPVAVRDLYALPGRGPAPVRRLGPNARHRPGAHRPAAPAVGRGLGRDPGSRLCRRYCHRPLPGGLRSVSRRFAARRAARPGLVFLPAVALSALLAASALLLLLARDRLALLVATLALLLLILLTLLPLAPFVFTRLLFVFVLALQLLSFVCFRLT